MGHFLARSHLPAPAERVFRWHMLPGALERLLPPWESTVVERGADVRAGSRVELRLGPGIHWVAEHREVKEGSEFRDVQVRGPMKSWEHVHRFIPADGGSILEDEIHFQPPGGWLGRKMAKQPIQARLDRTFRFRHQRTRHDIARHDAFADRPRLRVAITGASGTIGRQLVPFLRTGGHEVIQLVRDRERLGPDRIYWDPGRGDIDRDALEGVDAVVHLAAESIFGLRWTENKKTAIRTSRVDGTQLLARTLASLSKRPPVLVCSSGAHYYGDQGETPVREGDPAGEGFLAEVCRRWEQAAAPAKDAGIRVVHLRTGVVLSASGGALKTMLPAFKAGLGVPFGDGSQFLPWIAHDDLLAIILTCLSDDTLQGPINAVAPNPVTNEQFTRCLNHVLRRPTAPRIPKGIITAGLGQMGDELLFNSINVVPTILQQAGFRWDFPTVEEALRFELGRMAAATERVEALPRAAAAE